MIPRSPGRGDLADRLRVMVVTQPRPAAGRTLSTAVAQCVAAGAGAIQLRDKDADARTLAETARVLLAITRPAGALLIVNDRVDVALAVGADAVHLGPDDLPVAAARRLAPPDFVIGYSTDDPEVAVQAAEAGADYFGVGAVYGTRSKPGLEDEAIGPTRVAAVARAVHRPCVGIGGITAENAGPVFEAGAGVAVLSAVMDAAEPKRVVEALVRLAVVARSTSE